jgi:hypothetical protein
VPGRKKERYIDRWRKQHKEVRLYLKKEEYEALERLASEHNVTVKDFILKFINDINDAAEEAYIEGCGDAIDDFVRDPYEFYGMVRAYASLLMFAPSPADEKEEFRVLVPEGARP